jgi:ribosomal-protein-serine acetyltransferase
MEKIEIAKELNLRQISKSDCSDFFQLIERNRVYLREWLAWLDVTKTEGDLETFIARTTKEIADKKALCYLIWSKNKIAGIIHLRDIDKANKKAMIGYWIGEDYRGQGLAKEATKALTQLAFQHLNLNRIEIRCAPGNTASQAIPNSLGFKKEGLLRDNEWLYDHFVDHIVYSALAHEWV